MLHNLPVYFMQNTMISFWLDLKDRCQLYKLSVNGSPDLNQRITDVLQILALLRIRCFTSVPLIQYGPALLISEGHLSYYWREEPSWSECPYMSGSRPSGSGSADTSISQLYSVNRSVNAAASSGSSDCWNDYIAADLRSIWSFSSSYCMIIWSSFLDLFIFSLIHRSVYLLSFSW